MAEHEYYEEERLHASDGDEDFPPEMLDPNDVETFEKHPLPKQAGYVSRIVKEASIWFSDSSSSFLANKSTYILYIFMCVIVD